jgi:hypothetical protein
MIHLLFGLYVYAVLGLLVGAMIDSVNGLKDDAGFLGRLYAWALWPLVLVLIIQRMFS